MVTSYIKLERIQFSHIMSNFDTCFIENQPCHICFPFVDALDPTSEGLSKSVFS